MMDIKKKGMLVIPKKKVVICVIPQPYLKAMPYI